MICDLRVVYASGGFTLTKWISNSRSVLASVPEEDRAKAVKDLDLEKDRLPMERAFGVRWRIETDTFRFKVKSTGKPLTR